MCMMPHAAPCECICAHCAWTELKDYGWIENESEHNLYLACEDSPQCAFLFCTFSRSLLAVLAFFVHRFCCFLFLSVANCQLHSALDSAKHIRCGGCVALSSTSSIVKKRCSFLGPVLDLRQCMWRMGSWACTWCKWVQIDIPERDSTRTYVHTYIARIDPSSKPHANALSNGKALKLGAWSELARL